MSDPILSEMVPPGAIGYTTPTAEFDGRTFNVPLTQNGTLGMLLGLHLARLARGGDAEAAALLTAFHVTVYDAQGKTYWPEEEPAVPKTSPGGTFGG